MSGEKKYVVIATRSRQIMCMSWSTQVEQLSCARYYAERGWGIELDIDYGRRSEWLTSHSSVEAQPTT